MNKYTGSGIFIIENHNGKKYALLFGNKKTYFSELGGKIEGNETIEKTACRETKEETANLINIKENQIKCISKKILHKHYLSYIIFIEKINIKDYYHNINLVYNNCKDHYWKETKDIIRIELNKLIDCVKNEKYYVFDKKGNKILIRNRTVGIIKKSFDVLENLENPIKLIPKTVIKNKEKCLIGTNTYILQS